MILSTTSPQNFGFRSMTGALFQTLRRAHRIFPWANAHALPHKHILPVALLSEGGRESGFQRRNRPSAMARIRSERTPWGPIGREIVQVRWNRRIGTAFLSPTLLKRASLPHPLVPSLSLNQRAARASVFGLVGRVRWERPGSVFISRDSSSAGGGVRASSLP